MKQKIFLLFFLFAGVAAAAQVYRPLPDREAELNKKYTTGLFSILNADYFDLENDPAAISALAYLNVLDWLQDRVAGLQVYHVRDVPVPYIRNSPAAVFVDEMRMDPDYLNMLPVADIAMIKVVKTPAALLWGAPGGAIAIYTKRGEAEEAENADQP